MLIPKIGDTVHIRSNLFDGPVVLTYIDEQYLFRHELYPFQGEINEADLATMEEGNHGQNIIRFNLTEIQSEPADEVKQKVITDNIQGSLFDDLW